MPRGPARRRAARRARAARQSGGLRRARRHDPPRARRRPRPDRLGGARQRGRRRRHGAAAVGAGAGAERRRRIFRRRRGQGRRHHQGDSRGGLLPALRHRADHRRLQGDERFEPAAADRLRRPHPQRRPDHRGLRRFQRRHRRRPRLARRAFPRLLHDRGRRRGRLPRGPVRARPAGAARAPGRDPGRARRRHKAGDAPRRQPADRGRAARRARPHRGRERLGRQSRGARPLCPPDPRPQPPAIAGDDGADGAAADRHRERPDQRLDALPHRHQQRRQPGQGLAIRHAQHHRRQRRRQVRALGSGGQGPEHDRLCLHQPDLDLGGDEHRPQSRQRRRARLPHRLCPARPAGRRRRAGADQGQHAQSRGRIRSASRTSGPRGRPRARASAPRARSRWSRC